jgi:hypothetical protein
MEESKFDEQQAILEYTRLMEAGPVASNEERLQVLIEQAYAHGKYFDFDYQANAYRLIGQEDRQQRGNR